MRSLILPLALAALVACTTKEATYGSSDVVALPFTELQDTLRPKAGEGAVLVNVWASW